MAISLRNVSGCSLANLRVVTPTSQVIRGMRSAKWKMTRYLSGLSVRIGSINGAASIPPLSSSGRPPAEPPAPRHHPRALAPAALEQRETAAEAAGADHLDLAGLSGLFQRQAQQQFAGR